MTNKLEISRELAQKVDDLLYIMTGHDSYPRLVHKYGKEWWASINEMRAEICTLLAAPVVERQETAADDLKAFEAYWYAQKTTAIGSAEAQKYFSTGIVHGRKSLKGEPIAYWYQHAPNQDPGLCFLPTGTVPGGVVKALYAELPAPVAVVLPEFEPEFEAWWESDGQYCRAGGGSYEKTFAYRAYEAAIGKVKELNQ